MRERVPFIKSGGSGYKANVSLGFSCMRLTAWKYILNGMDICIWFFLCMSVLSVCFLSSMILKTAYGAFMLFQSLTGLSQLCNLWLFHRQREPERTVTQLLSIPFDPLELPRLHEAIAIIFHPNGMLFFLSVCDCLGCLSLRFLWFRGFVSATCSCFLVAAL